MFDKCPDYPNYPEVRKFEFLSFIAVTFLCSFKLPSHHGNISPFTTLKWNKEKKIIYYKCTANVGSYHNAKF